MSNEQQQQQQQIRGALVAVMVSEPGRRHKSTGFRFMNSVVRQMSIALALRVASRVAVFISELDGAGPAVCMRSQITLSGSRSRSGMRYPAMHDNE